MNHGMSDSQFLRQLVAWYEEIYGKANDRKTVARLLDIADKIDNRPLGRRENLRENGGGQDPY